ncbi:ketopantoate reductase family protein [Bacillus sp. FJAT-28004]|uniref:ketopantoate reductase family protein n=1 Tax=Bacillus sp. FJAT-28004 TaxID=1679165 RepID=UPI0006B63D20|nr:2-dehydropantoate 2-reductase [Bacillus sp. FJAT-28004]
MQIDVVGGGSLGLLYGAKLAEAGAHVTIWTRSEEQAALLESQGVRLRELAGTSEKLIRVKGSWSGSVSEHRELQDTKKNHTDFRWVLLTVKQSDLDEAFLNILALLLSSYEGESAAVVCMQNGIGHLERIKNRFPNYPLFAAVTTEGAKRLDSRSVEHTGKGQLWLGEWDGNERNRDESLDISQKMLISLLETAGFTSFLSKDLENRIFNKLLINAVINPLTALLDVENGQLPLHTSGVKLMQALYEETEFVLVHAGMTLPGNGWELIINVCRQTSRNISSMLSDVRAGRTTEIEAINGGVVWLAEKNGLQAPLNQAVVKMVQALHLKPTMRE